MLKTKDIREQLKNKLNLKLFVTDKTGVKTVELLGPSFIANESAIFGKLNEEYAEKELYWYTSMSRNVYDMPNPPAIWKQVADKNGYIHSNYGYLMFSEDNDEQYQNCLRQLRADPDSRRAMMIYTRPSMQYEYNDNGMSDFICTNNAQVFIRDNELHYLINQRSCDAVFGYKNDLYWHKFIQLKLKQDLMLDYPELELGDVIYQIGSLHVYERHFKLIK